MYTKRWRTSCIDTQKRKSHEVPRVHDAKNADAGKRRQTGAPLGGRTGKRSSPGSGEDEDKKGESADLQPDDVENDDTAR
jgi:hypothetical protein